MRMNQPMATAHETPTPTPRGWLRPCLVWAGLLFIPLVLLLGRHDWSLPTRGWALRGYLSSAYLLVLLLPATYYLLLRLTQRRRLAVTATGVIGLICCLPYHWLGLDRFYYHLGRPTHWDWSSPSQSPPAFDWLPQALQNLRGMPHEVPFFAALAAIGTIVAIICLVAVRCADSAGNWRHRRRVALFLGVFLLILAQTWLHLSMRSPNTYRGRMAPNVNGWFLDYLFPDGQGAVCSDYYAWRGLEDHFMGTRTDTETMFLRRSFPFYVSSQFSYFFNPLHVFLVLNTLLWFSAAYCAFRFALSLWNERVAVYFTLFVASACGFIVVVAQPKAYLAGYASIMILVHLFNILVVDRPRPGWRDCILFGVLLGFGAMTYDVLSLYVFLPLYIWVRRGHVRYAGLSLISIGISFAIALGFLALQKYVLRIEFNPVNAQHIKWSAENIIRLIAHPDVPTLYIATLEFLKAGLGHLANAFLVLPAILALLGLFFRDRQHRMDVCFLLALPAVGSFAFLSFGDTTYAGHKLASLPRFIYFAYPTVYLLAAMFLDHVHDRLGRHAPRLAAGLVAALLLAAVIVLNNLDAFGFPQLYYLWTWPVDNGDWQCLTHSLDAITRG